jgi:hypothetical protein
VLGKAFRAIGVNPPAPPTTAPELKDQLEDLRRSGHREASAVVVIDQFEELLISMKPLGDDDEDLEANHFLTFLADLVGKMNGNILVMATLRSDFL